MKKRSQDFSEKITRWIGSTQSIIVHTIFFVGIFSLHFFDFSSSDILLILTTLVSLEAIYLAIFIQITINRHSENLVEVSEDIEELQEDVEEISEDVDEIQKDVEEISEDVDEIQKDVEEISEEDEIEAKEEEKEDKEEKQKFKQIEETLQTLLKEISELKNKK